MALDAAPTSPTRAQIAAALREFQSTPGKFSVASRQPAVLFSTVREVLQMAAGRTGTSGEPADETDSGLRQAATFFTRTALLYPGADHYALLGLDRVADAAAVKDRYRQMMRVIHPDFSGVAATTWPADAPARVNLAYEVLCSTFRRREYDEQLAAAASPPSPRPEIRRPPPRPVAVPTDPKTTLKWIVAACGIAAVTIMGGSFLFGSRQDPVLLVQRSPVLPAVVAEPPPAPVPATVAAPLVAVAPAPALPVAPRVAVAAPAPAPAPVLNTPIPEPARPAAVALAAPARAAPLPAPVVPAAVRQPEPLAVAVAVPAPAPAPVQAAPLAPPPVVAARVAPPELAPVAAAPAPPPPMARPVVTLAEAQPLLSALLQYIEGGRGERLLNLLDREARAAPGAQALSRQFDVLVDGARPVKLTHVEFKAEPADGRLLVTGQIRLHTDNQTIGSMGKKLVLRAEFANRDGTVVMTGLSGSGSN